MPTAPKVNALDYDALKDKHRALRAGFPDWHSLRIHRALSWLKRSEKELSDHDVRFILLWIGFNAAYASEFVSDDVLGERDSLICVFYLLHLRKTLPAIIASRTGLEQKTKISSMSSDVGTIATKSNSSRQHFSHKLEYE